MFTVKMMPGQTPYSEDELRTLYRAVSDAADGDPGEQDEPVSEWREIGQRDTRSDADKLLRWMYRGNRNASEQTTYRVRHLGRGKGYAVDGLFRVR